MREGARDAVWSDDTPPALIGLAWAAPEAYLRRPFSIADRWEDDAGRTHMTVISRNIGRGTGWLDGLHPGAALDVLGPLGRGFRLPNVDRAVLLVGGGVGIPPMIYTARRLWESGRQDVAIIFGAMSRDLFPLALTNEPDAGGEARVCLVLPAGAHYPAAITTDDGTLGRRGQVTDAMRLWRLQRPGRAATVLACGPEGMLAAVAKLARELNLACQLCIERHMGCGLGTCLSCVVRVVDSSRPQGWRWALSCGEGPVFEAESLYDPCMNEK